MILHRRREFQARNQFTSSNPIHKASNDLNSLDGIEYGTWAETIKGNYGSFGKSDDHKIGAWQRRNPLNHLGNQVDENEFRWLAKDENDDSDVPSPQLWKKPASPMTERAQAIARYRQEMLDMVRDLPEADYELSLRDIVESPRIAKPVQKTLAEGEEFSNEKRKKGRRRMSRSESIEPEGLLLKMFLPNSLAARRKSFGGSGACSKLNILLLDLDFLVEIAVSIAS
ncbi:hypothetical protein COCNU_02G011450 [Cocos nucifera]|uniref:Uncharacterized protein n=1 Tax=Cocos nucifera TaxID=13894 RepID=A0A8K0MX71_COCNU|nr:hypothetical protein COCNU_02G011450 [Cocos nucifera]